jgi:hypothetical protein
MDGTARHGEVNDMPSYIMEASLEGFTVFENCKLRFSPGLNVIIGEPGAGKTHLLKAVYFSAVCLANSKINPMLKLAGVYQLDSFQDLIRHSGGAAKVSIECSQDLFARFELERSDEQEVELDKEMLDFRKRVPPFMLHQVIKGELDSEPVLVPSVDVLSFTKGFLSLYDNRKLDFDDVTADVIRKLLTPPLREIDSRIADLEAYIQKVIGARLDTEGERFVFSRGSEKVSAPLAAQSHRKLAIILRLVQTGAIVPGSLLLWDEPENGASPSLMDETVEVFTRLVEAGVQVIVATHSYLLMKQVELSSRLAGELKMFSLQSSPSGSIVYSGDRLSDLPHNSTLTAYADLAERALAHDIQRMRDGY